MHREVKRSGSSGSQRARPTHRCIMATLRAVRALATLMTIEAAPIVYFRPKEMEPAPEGQPAARGPGQLVFGE